MEEGSTENKGMGRGLRKQILLENDRMKCSAVFCESPKTVIN